MADSQQHDTMVVFPSALGWMTLIGSGLLLRRLTFGHRGPKAAVRALGPQSAQTARPGSWNRQLVARLQAYASGAPEDFGNVPIETGTLTEFQRRVIRHCRQIPLAKTLTYGQLAARAGYPGAARAVGNCMASNPIPLIVPCHRVVAAGGRLGGYSAPGGTRLKRRLLDLEASCFAS